MPTKPSSRPSNVKTDSNARSKSRVSSRHSPPPKTKKTHLTNSSNNKSSTKAKAKPEEVETTTVKTSKTTTSSSRHSKISNNVKDPKEIPSKKKESKDVIQTNVVSVSRRNPPSKSEKIKKSLRESSISRPPISKTPKEEKSSTSTKSKPRKPPIEPTKSSSTSRRSENRRDKHDDKNRQLSKDRGKEKSKTLTKPDKISKHSEGKKSESISKEGRKHREGSKLSTSVKSDPKPTSDATQKTPKNTKDKREKPETKAKQSDRLVNEEKERNVQPLYQETQKASEISGINLEEERMKEKDTINEAPTEVVKKIPTNNEDLPNADPSPNSLETLTSGISMTSPHDLSDDGEVEESISSRFVEVDEMDLNVDDPSPPSSSTAYFRSPSSFPQSVDDFPSEMGADGDPEYQDYEEDFEDYESDFDDDDEEEEEESEDSEGSENEDSDDDDDDDDDEEEETGNSEPETDPQMAAILKAMAEENNRPKVAPKPAVETPAVPFVSAFTKREPPPPAEVDETPPKQSRPKTSKVYVNFARAKERAKNDKTSGRLKNRGQLLQELIQLDTVAFELFNQAPASYEAYIAAFGSSNSTQASVQTNEDALAETIQTDPIHTLEKWTQKPIHIPVNGENFPTPQDYLGVGGEAVFEEGDSYAIYNALSSKSGRLTKFLAASSQVVLMLLEESNAERESSVTPADNESLGFSQAGVGLGSGLMTLLEGRSCTFAMFCPLDTSLLLSGHGFIDPNNNDESNARNAPNTDELKDELEDESLDSTLPSSGALLCLWAVRQPSFPQRILTCRSPPTVASFSPGRPRIVAAGLDDGSLAAWDLRESVAGHPASIVIGETKWKLSPPSYITACSQEDALEGSSIVALEAVRRADDEDEEIAKDGSFQLVSLSSSGQLTWWVLVQKELRPTRVVDADNPGICSELGAAPWSRIILSRAHTICVSQLLQSEDLINISNLCYDLKLSGNDLNQLYVATANGSVLNCSRHYIKMHPPFFTPELEPGTAATSVSMCPHDPHYFLVGGLDGLIRLHCANASTPLTCWQASINPSPVVKVQWSPSRPCVFYMLDNQGRFHIWDLSAGDIFPIISIEDGGLIGGQLVSFDIAKQTGDNSQPLYAVFASESGALGIRSVSTQFTSNSNVEYKKELERFKCYVNII